MSKLDDSAAKLADKASEYLTAFESLAKQFAPDVVNGALTVVQVNAVNEVVGSLLLLLLMVLAWRFAWPHIKREKAKGWEDQSDFVAHVAPFCGGIATVVLSFASIVTLFSVWTWVAIFNPKLYMAYKLFGKFL